MTFEIYPNFDYDRHKDELLLRSNYDFPDCGIYGLDVDCPVAKLYPSGRLTVKAGFIWDAGTGAIDTIAMVVASLLHDALCRMVNREFLEAKHRKNADKTFRKTLNYWCQSHPVEREWRWARWHAVKLITSFKRWFK